jgi:hypothetical protein
MIILKWFGTLKDEMLLQRQDEQELLDMYEEMILRFFVGPS